MGWGLVTTRFESREPSESLSQKSGLRRPPGRSERFAPARALCPVEILGPGRLRPPQPLPWQGIRGFSVMHLHQDVSRLGWTAFFESQHRAFGARQGDVLPARVAAASHGLFQVLAPDGVKRAVLAGKLRHNASDNSELPVVGDW